MSDHSRTIEARHETAPEVATAIDLALRWGDMDLNHHINNVQIARLLEELRVRAMNTWFGDTRTRPVVVVRQEIEFSASMPYDTRPARGVIWVSRTGGSSFDLAATISASDGTPCVRAETTLVAVDDTGGPAPLDPDMRSALDARSAPPLRLRRPS